MLTNNVKEIDFTFYAKTFICLIDEYPESYGCNVFIDIVSGSKRKNLPEILVKSKYYSIHSDVSKDHLKTCMSYLIDSNLIKKTGDYSVLILTSNGKKWLLHDNPTLIVKIFLPQELCGELEDINIVNLETQAKKEKKGPSYIQTYELFHNQNKTVHEIANIRSLTNKTIEDHLIDCLKSGLNLDFNRLGLTKEKQESILKIIKSLNSDVIKLKPIKDACEKLNLLDITYFDIKCTIIFMK
jgi:hypothetical protein